MAQIVGGAVFQVWERIPYQLGIYFKRDFFGGTHLFPNLIPGLGEKNKT